LVETKVVQHNPRGSHQVRLGENKCRQPCSYKQKGLFPRFQNDSLHNFKCCPSAQNLDSLQKFEYKTKKLKCITQITKWRQKLQI